MCECLAYAEGGMFLCEACAPMWEEYLASLGGKAVVVDSADAAAEPPGDLLAPLSVAYKRMYAGILSADLIGESAQWLTRFIEPYLQEAAAIATREAKREAVGILKALLENPWPPHRQETFAAMSAARAFIAAFEAEQEKP